jgi:selenocysteine lyase/cysteine desulfurase
MIYLDNAATSRFKPKSVIDAVLYDLKNSANSGRSGHKAAIEAGIRIENCRAFLLKSLGAENGYNIVFTKNCTEALNLAMLGSLKGGERVVTTANEHNSVLRPLFELKNKGVIQLFIVAQNENGSISHEHLARAMSQADVAVLSPVSNVTGARINTAVIGEYAARYGVRFIVDGAQSVPLCGIDMSAQNIDMLACPAHKGLHATQGVGFLIFRETIKLKPMLYGGTGTASFSTLQPVEAPEAYEAGTQYAGGIAALLEGAKWSFSNAPKTKKIIASLGDELVYYLKSIGATVYTKDPSAGVVSFNLHDADSALVAEELDERGIAVRSGLHCAPLVHRFLRTEKQGAVRASIGVDNTDREIYEFASALEVILKTKLLKR